MIKPRERLNHILTETRFLAKVAAKIQTPEQLASEEILRRSVERSIEIIGEAVKDIPQEIRQLSPSTKWSQIARMRDNLIHRYFTVDPKILYGVITENAPILQEEVAIILNQLNRQEYAQYRSNLRESKTIDNRLLAPIDQQIEIDVAIAKQILQEYPSQFREVAITKITEIISAGEWASDLATNDEKTTPEQYINEIITRTTK
ncbi:MAG: HepT-like ribonuclease domain-containing protein [Cyanobacteria bacterium P01_G01_bin.67]